MFSLTHYKALSDKTVVKIPSNIHRNTAGGSWYVDLDYKVLEFKDSDSKDDMNISLYQAKRFMILNHYTKQRDVLCQYLHNVGINIHEDYVSFSGTTRYGEYESTGVVVLARILDEDAGLVEIIDIDNMGYILLITREMLDVLRPHTTNSVQL